MYLSKVKIRNYKCFLDSKEIELTPGFNVVAGQNNAGKTAFLEALSLNVPNKPHHSRDSIGPTLNGLSSADISISFKGEELREVILVPGQNITLPHPSAQLSGAPRVGGQAKVEDHVAFATWVFSREGFTIPFRYSPGKLSFRTNSFLGLYPYATNSGPGFLVGVDNSRNICRPFTAAKTAPGGLRGAPAMNIPSTESLLCDYVKPRVYAFKAERFPTHPFHLDEKTLLAPNAQNLVCVLANLAMKRNEKMREFNQAVRQVLPLVHHIGVKQEQNHAVEIVVYTSPYERDELAFPVYECGSGISQVLAILYLVLCSNSPQVLLVDEPQSFLHPGAVRKLVDILKVHSEHQYILATHSPTVITAANPSTIMLVRPENGVSDFQRIDPKSNEELRGFLAEIGASLSDVFGADNILWVEGPTEQECFPLILDNAGVSLQGTAIIGITHTGDLEGKLKKTVWDIYKRISDGAGLLPPAKSFLFDRDKLLSTQPDKLTQDSKNKIRFLRRRMYENYLLDAEAIVARMNEIEGFREKPVEQGEVVSWIKEHGSGPKYKAEGNVGEAEWLKTVDGANLLLDLFNGLSETRVSYEKTRDSVALTRWFIEHRPEQLQEISDLLMEILKTSNPPA